MKNTTLLTKLPLVVLNEGKEKDINSFYAGDLLSWVMGRAGNDCCWLTIMSNINVSAVAVLLEASCVILCEDVTPDQSLLEKMQENNIALYSSKMNVFDTAKAISEMLK